jgi:hypothetical protein
MTGFPIAAAVAENGDSTAVAAGTTGWLSQYPNARTAPAA